MTSISTDTDGMVLMNKIYSADTLLVPADATTESLEAVAPIIRGRFVVHRYNRPSVELEIELRSSSNGDSPYEITHKSWSRHDRKDVRAPLEIYMIRLNG